MQLAAFRYYANSLAQLFFPVHCTVCGNALKGTEQVICLNCHLNLPITHSWAEGYNPAAEKFKGRIPVAQANSFLYFSKKGLAQHLIHQLKYGNRKDIAIYLGKMFGLYLKESAALNDVDFLIPVPLHPKKEKLRGYNQSYKIGEGLAQALQVPVLKNCLIKTKHTTSQTNKTTMERIENVKGVFAIKHSEKIKGKHILLIDDVLTTGSTLESCALTLMAVEDIKISIATLAIAID